MIRLIAAAVAAIALIGPAASETRALSGFRTVDAEDRLTVTISVADDYAVEVTGSDAARIRTRVEGRTLYIEDARRPWFGRSPPLDAQVRITAPAIEALSASRGVELEANLEGAPCSDLSVAAAMGGSATISAAECDAVSSSASMGGAVRLSGVCRSHNIAASMGGYVRADGLQCLTVGASAAMGGEVRAFASHSYNASASMGGSIRVGGGGAATRTATSLGGSVSNR